MPKTCLVTGAAGFIGSHLTEALLDAGWEVRAVDALRPSEAPGEREDNAAAFSDRTPLIRRDLTEDDLHPLLDGVDVVFHLAARSGVRASWGGNFSDYLRDNLLATQRLAEALSGRNVKRLVFASSSSIYGDAEELPTPETARPAPISPYGVTKLACEHLLRSYSKRGGLPVVLLRYFTVYGPRQRPDMALRRMFEAAASGAPFPLWGDGSQVREWTYVADAVGATIAAATREEAVGEAINVGGGSSASLSEVMAEVALLTGRRLAVDARPVAPGDVRVTGARIEKARRLLGYEPRTPWKEGLRKMADWFRERKTR